MDKVKIRIRDNDLILYLRENIIHKIKKSLYGDYIITSCHNNLIGSYCKQTKEDLEYKLYKVESNISTQEKEDHFIFLLISQDTLNIEYIIKEEFKRIRGYKEDIQIIDVNILEIDISSKKKKMITMG